MRAVPLTAQAPEVETLTIGFTDTSAEQLRFSLDHPRITPLASKRLDVTAAVPSADTDVVLELHVIGSSHQVALSVAGTDRFIETFACLGEDAGPPVHRPAWGRTRTTPGSWAGFSRHEFRSHRQEVPGDFGSAVAEVLDLARAAAHHIVVGFPGDPHAVTALAATRVEPGCVAWQTWHCYPQHRQIVHSASRLDVAQSEDTETDGERS